MYQEANKRVNFAEQNRTVDRNWPTLFLTRYLSQHQFKRGKIKRHAGFVSFEPNAQLLVTHRGGKNIFWLFAHIITITNVLKYFKVNMLTWSKITFEYLFLIKNPESSLKKCDVKFRLVISYMVFKFKTKANNFL